MNNVLSIKNGVTLTILFIVFSTPFFIPVYSYEKEQTQTVKGYTITFSTIPEQTVVGQSTDLIFNVTDVTTGEYESGSYAVVHIYGPGIHKVLTTDETLGLKGHYKAEYTFPLLGAYDVALEISIKGKEIWAFFELFFGQPPSAYEIFGRVVFSMALAVSAILGLISTIRLSAQKKLLSSLFIVFLSLSFALAFDAEITRHTAVVYVLNEDGDPIGDALITLNGPITASDVTDGGYCIFRDVPRGLYSITASAEGYTPNTIEVTVEVGEISYFFVFLSA